MADEKKSGFFKRWFGFGKTAEPVSPPAPEAPPPAPAPSPAEIIEQPPILDEAAERIAAEIAEAKRQAELAAAEEARLAREAEQAEAERLAAEQAKAEAAERAKAVAAEKARAEAARKAEAARFAEEQRKADEKAAAEKAASERAAAEKAAAAEVAARAEAERARRVERERLEQDARAAAEKAEAERIAAERAAAEKAEVKRRAAEDARLAAERAEQERLTAKRAEAERIAAEKAEAERLAAERAEQERLAAEKAEAERRAREEQERLAEQARIAAEKSEADRRAAEIAAAAAATAAAKAEPAPRQSWWQKLKSGLSRTASSVSEGITGLFTKRKLDDETLEELEDLLIQADLGIDVAARISAAVGKGRYDKEIAPEEVKAILAEEVAKVLQAVAKPLEIPPGRKPFVLLMAGVNGSGKTTTIGKLASKFRAEGKSVMLAAGDTFRAAAIEQLKVWGERTGAPVVARDQGGDAAGLAFDAVKAAQEQGVDVLLIDTAGRLQNRTELMAELEKVIRVIRKLDDTAPHASLLVLDATVGQNALSQVDIFGKTAGITGLVMTKLDGTARGGILVAIAEKYKLPIHFIGVGEGVDDLEPFAATDFARAIAGLEQLGR